MYNTYISLIKQIPIYRINIQLTPMKLRGSSMKLRKTKHRHVTVTTKQETVDTARSNQKYYSSAFYDIERISGYKWLGETPKTRKLFYKVRWQNSDAAGDSWQLASQLLDDVGVGGIDELLQEFHSRSPTGDLRMLEQVAEHAVGPETNM